MSGSTANRIKEGAKSAATKVETATTEAVNNPVQAKNDFLHLPFTRAALPFVNGGLAGMFATGCIQPIDMVKVRLQLAGEGIKTGPKPTAMGITKDIIAQGKVLDLYTGLSAGLLRQAVYTTARLGFFDTFQNMLQARAEKNGTNIGFLERGAAGLTAGGLAAVVGNPADLALIRMQSDGLKPKEARANYRSVFDALTNCQSGRCHCSVGRRISHRRACDGSQLWSTHVFRRIQGPVEDPCPPVVGKCQSIRCLCNCRFLCFVLQLAV